MNFGFLLRDSFSDCVFGGGGWGVLVCFIIKILYFKKEEKIYGKTKRKRRKKNKRKRKRKENVKKRNTK